MEGKLWYDEYEWLNRPVKYWRVQFPGCTVATFDTLDAAIAWRADVELNYK